MNAHALDTHAGPEPARQADPARLAEANIHPATGLATDYLNHFNEAIMMLELSDDIPLTGVAQAAVDAVLERRS